MQITDKMVYEFDRYINGTLMAEGVTIERQADPSSAMREGARIAPRGPNGEVPVLVLRSPSPAQEAGAEPVAFVEREVLDRLSEGKAANHVDLTARRGNRFTEPLYASPTPIQAVDWEKAAFWRNDALTKAAEIAERHGADPQIAADIRALLEPGKEGK